MGDLERRIRAGDVDRTRVVEALGRHLAEGRLTVDEFDERTTRAHAAVYLDQLPQLLADLPGDPEPAPRRAAPPTRMSVAAVFVVMAVLLTSSVVAVAHGAAPLFGVLLLFLFLRHRRWSHRW